MTLGVAVAAAAAAAAGAYAIWLALCFQLLAWNKSEQFPAVLTNVQCKLRSSYLLIFLDNNARLQAAQKYR